MVSPQVVFTLLILIMIVCSSGSDRTKYLTDQLTFFALDPHFASYDAINSNCTC